MIENKLKQIKTEDFIWIVYIFIIFLSFYSNDLEKNYYLYNDNISKEKYRKIIIFIFSILIIVYYYFLHSSLNDIKNLSVFASDKEKFLKHLSATGSLLIFISGLIFLYIAVVDDDLSVELAFN